jgi:predicted porin
VLEYRLDATSNQPVGSSPVGLTSQSGPARQQLLGLTHAEYGTVAAGRLQTAAYDWAVAFDPLAGSSISPLQFNNGGFNIGATAVHARANNAIAYIAPTFYGITLAANYALASENVGVAGTGNATGNPSTQASATLLSLKSVAGDLAVGVVYDKQSTNANLTTTTPVVAGYYNYNNVAGVATWVPATGGVTSIYPGNQIDIATGVSYNFGVAKVFGTFQTHKVQYQTNAAANADKAYSLAGVVPLGSDAVVGSFSRLIKSSVQLEDKSQTAYTLAYTHPFSKLTTLYTSYSHIGNGLNATKGAGTVGDVATVTGDANASVSPIAGGNAQLFTVGINKKF